MSFRKAEDEHRAALAILNKLTDDNPRVTQIRSKIAYSQRLLGNARLLTGKLPEADASFRSAMGIYQKLADDNPAVAEYRKELTGCHGCLGYILAATGKPSEAAAEYGTSIASLRTLIIDNPADTGFRTSEAAGQAFFGILLLQMGKPEEAEAECRAALATLQNLADGYPDIFRIRDRLASALMYLGDVVYSRGSAIDAKGLYERAIAVKEPQVTENAKSWEHRYVLACLLRRRGLMLRDLGKPVGAAADVRRAVQLCEALPPRSHWDLIETACCHAALAGLMGRTASGVSAAQGEAEAAHAIAWLRRAVDIRASAYQSP